MTCPPIKLVRPRHGPRSIQPGSWVEVQVSQHTSPQQLVRHLLTVYLHRQLRFLVQNLRPSSAPSQRGYKTSHQGRQILNKHPHPKPVIMKLHKYLFSILSPAYIVLARTFSPHIPHERPRSDITNRTTILPNQMRHTHDRRLLRNIDLSRCIKRGLQVCLLPPKLWYTPSSSPIYTSANHGLPSFLWH